MRTVKEIQDVIYKLEDPIYLETLKTIIVEQHSSGIPAEMLYRIEAHAEDTVHRTVDETIAYLQQIIEINLTFGRDCAEFSKHLWLEKYTDNPFVQEHYQWVNDLPPIELLLDDVME